MRNASTAAVSSRPAEELLRFQTVENATVCDHVSFQMSTGSIFQLPGANLVSVKHLPAKAEAMWLLMLTETSCSKVIHELMLIIN